MCFVHAFLPSDFFVYLVELLLASSGYGRYQSQIEVSYTSCQGASPLWEFPPLRSLRWPRLLPRLRLPGSLLCFPAAAVFLLAIPVCTGPPGHDQVAAHARSPFLRGEDEPEAAKAAASRCRSRSPAVRVAAERRWLRPPNPLRLPAVAPAAAPHTLGRQAPSCLELRTGDLRIVSTD